MIPGWNVAGLLVASLFEELRRPLDRARCFARERWAAFSPAPGDLWQTTDGTLRYVEVTRLRLPERLDEEVLVLFTDARTSTPTAERGVRASRWPTKVRGLQLVQRAHRDVRHG